MSARVRVVHAIARMSAREGKCVAIPCLGDNDPKVRN